MSELLCGDRKIHPGWFEFNPLLSQGGLKRGNAHPKEFEFGHQAGDPRIPLTQVPDFILEGFNPFFEFVHFLRRSFASLGELRVALGARPASILTPTKPSRNLHMETAMPGTRRLIPERAEVISAYRMVTNPDIYANEPDLHEKMQHAWQVLLADRRMRIEAKRAAQTIRSTFPEDAA